jgi:hypothetical protein
MDRLSMIYLIEISVFSFRFKTMAWKTTHTNVHIMCSTSSLTNDPFSCNVWGKIYYVFQSNNLDITIKLKHLIFGYKISDNNYHGANYFRIKIIIFKNYLFSFS